MTKIRVWDPLLRVFHWALAVGFTADALLIDDDSRLHENIGLVVLALIGLRLIWGLIGPKHARFSDFPPRLQAALSQLADIAAGRVRRHLGHSPLGALMVYNLLISVAAIGISGWAMTVFERGAREGLEELHEGLVVWAGLSVLVHILAVLVESRRTGVNLPRAMVTGYKELPGDPAGPEQGGGK